MRVQIKKITTLTILILFGLFTSCQIDENTNENKTNNKLPFSISKVKYNELESNKLLLNKLKNVKELNNNKDRISTSAKIVFIPQFGYYIDTDLSNYIESLDGDYHSYTFPIIHTEQQDDKIKNLVLVFNQITEDYDAYIISYQLSFEEKEKIQNNQFVDLANKSTIQPITNFDTNTLLKTIIYIDPDTGDVSCWDEIYGISSSTGWGNQIISYTEVPCNFLGNTGGGSDSSGSGTGNDSSTGSNGSGNGTNNTNSGGGIPSGGGSGSGINNVVTTPILPSLTTVQKERKKCFMDNILTPEQSTWLNQIENQEIKEDILKILKTKIFLLIQKTVFLIKKLWIL
jgi:hypothetical protein